ncbi:MAG: hypothetical protein LBK00_00460 [Treponema sp.]|jgi:hypothetical protein|nr:hypothetical protein [Treponema sp.]
MKEKLFLTGMFSIILTFGIVVMGCDTGSGDSGNGNSSGNGNGNNSGNGNGTGNGGGNSNSFEGTWIGTATFEGNSSPATITITGSTWNFVCEEAGMDESGSYTPSGNSATLTSGDTVIGSATISGNNLSVTLSGGDYEGGTGTFTKGSDGNSNPFEGTWIGKATFEGNSSPATITITGSTWKFVCEEAGMDESGSYTPSGNSATLKSGDTVIGSATISGSTLSVTLSSGDYAGGTGTFTK